MHKQVDQTVKPRQWICTQQA